MALKNWFKDKKEKDRWINPNNNNSIEIDSVGKTRFIVVVRDENVYQIDGDEFKTKPEAVAFARSYMRRH